ncbi:MAG: DUF6471 domain-containing protein [Sphingobium sp.]
MKDWNAYAKGILRAEMTKRQISYADLRALLAHDGVKETEANLRNKVSRGSFTAAFLLQCLAVMKVANLHLDVD